MNPASEKNIYIYNKVCSDKDLNTLYSFCKSVEDQDWVESFFYRDGKSNLYPDKKTNLHNHNPILKQIMDNVFAFIINSIEWNYGTRIIHRYHDSIRKMSSGAEILPHADNEFNDGTFFSIRYTKESVNTKNDFQEHLPNEFVEYSSIFYINDDYEGGEICFPDYNLEIKPEAGSVVFFPSNSKYIHAVKKVIKGDRYAVPSLWYSEKAVILNSIAPYPYAQEIVEKQFMNKFVESKLDLPRSFIQQDLDLKKSFIQNS